MSVLGFIWDSCVPPQTYLIRIFSLRSLDYSCACKSPGSTALAQSFSTGKKSESVSHQVVSDSFARHTVLPMTVARQAPLSMEFSRQECWSGQASPSPGDLSDLGIKPGLLHCRQILCHLNHILETLAASWEACMQIKKQQLDPDMEQQTGSKLERSISRLCIVTLLI